MHNKKCGLIEFKTKSSADRVIKEKNKIALKGQSLKIEYSYVKIKAKDSHEQKECKDLQNFLKEEKKKCIEEKIENEIEE